MKKTTKRLLAAGIGLVCVLGANAASGVKRVNADKGIFQITTTADFFGDGEKVTSAIITYKKKIAPDSVSADDYTVEGKTIQSVAVDGKKVTLFFDCSNIWEKEFDSGIKAERDLNNRIPLDVKVTQTGEVTSEDGATIYEAGTAVASANVSVPKEFKIFDEKIWNDNKTDVEIRYSLYIPENYGGKNYPLVVFIPDASANTNVSKTVLTQGNGGIIWARPEEQAKHEAIVLAIQYPKYAVDKHGPLVTDDYQWNQNLQTIYNLIQFIKESFRIDKKRIYGIGQSQGCMANIAISCKYPNLYRALWLVAGQWDADEMAALKDKDMWIVVCEGDQKAYPGMNKAVEKLKENGARVAKSQMWNPRSTPEQFDSLVKDMLAQNANINYTVFEGGNHMYTWSVAYNIDGIRDWLFSQK